jgi:carbamoyl-phosphate synthase small subunit
LENTGYLILENGHIFKGRRFGASGDITGEIVFTTAMTGYLETLTDSSYYGQIVVQTFPLIGNYGVIPSDFESSEPHLKAYIVREWCQEPSNFRSEGALDAFLKSHNIIGLSNIDTRALAKMIRKHGTMNARIASSKQVTDAVAKKLKEYKIENAVESVSCKEFICSEINNPKYNVVLWDFGAKESIQNMLGIRDCSVTVVPCSATADEIISLKPDGVVLSNGPGDPADNTGIIKEIHKLCNTKIPLFAISLGHQLLALSQGAKTEKLKYGHRGANQPVKEISTGRVYITSQNHGYSVIEGTLPVNAAVSFSNSNDGTVEGIDYTDMPAFSVQFYPEAAGGPLNTEFLFDRFVDLMKEGC